MTGKPVWPIEERPVAEGRRAGRVVFADAAVPDQAAGRTIGRASSIDDLIDFTPELRAEAVKLVVALQDRSDLHAAGRQQGRGPARRR